MKLQVLDLGCGSGRDCYVTSALVGERGSVIGLDMTPSQLQVRGRPHCRLCSLMNLRFSNNTLPALSLSSSSE